MWWYRNGGTIAFITATTTWRRWYAHLPAVHSTGGVPAWIFNRLDQVDLNSGPVARLFNHLAEKNTPRAQKVLLAADAVADELGLDHDLLEDIIADLGL